ncbi:MAG: Phosphoserine phosphatase SerB1 [Gammaproteobacteria bacterium]|nr:Phosphoserine phosphatase SerB1 [Gammaproteobacteria bacterium]
MALALFDLDHTLLSGDSDHAWGLFLAERTIVEPEIFEQRSNYYMAEYDAGRLDIREFLDFQLTPLVEERYEALAQLREEYIEEKIQPLVTESARTLVAYHRGQGDTLAIITATNSFITRPIANLFGIEHLIATELEFIDGAFTGKIIGEPCFREGKVAKFNDWLARSGCEPRGSWFYTDSWNDLPLLECVDHPVAVNPDAVLECEALRRNWPIRRF